MIMYKLYDNEDQSINNIIDLITSIYESGVGLKKIIKDELELRINHRSFELYLFGNHGGYEPYKINGSTHGMSCSELYISWRKSVINSLENKEIPKYLKLKFLNTEEQLIDEKKYGTTTRKEQLAIALGNIDKTLHTFLQIIHDIPEQKPQKSFNRKVVTEYGEYKVLEDGSILISGNDIHLSPQQHRLVKAFIEARGKPLSKENIIDLMWGEEFGRENYLENPNSQSKIPKRISNMISVINSVLRTNTKNKWPIQHSSGQSSSYKLNI